MEYSCIKLFIIFINYLSREKICLPGKVLSNRGWKTHLENVPNLGLIRIFREVDILHASRVFESIILHASGDRIPPHVQENNSSRKHTVIVSHDLQIQYERLIVLRKACSAKVPCRGNSTLLS